MRLNSYRSKLLVTVSALVLGSCSIILILVTYSYSLSLLKASTTQAEDIAHVLAIEATDKILTNDLVSLQKMLNHQVQSNPFVSYLFIVKNDQVLAHTFTNGIPLELITANDVIEDGHGNFMKIASTQGEQYIDIAWPIFSGKAGVLRIGLNENPYKSQMNKLLIQISMITLGILFIALVLSHLFIKRITEPLTSLANAVEKIDEEYMEINVKIKGHDEVGKLTSSFNRMLDRIRDYTRRLEEKTMQLDRAHYQVQSSFAIVQKIGAKQNLNDICLYLIKKFKEIVACKKMLFLVFSSSMDILYIFPSKENDNNLKKESLKKTVAYFEKLKGMTFINKNKINPLLISDDFKSEKRLAIFPFNYNNQLLGALLVGCADECRCDKKELKVVDLILNKASGAIRRAVMQEEEIREIHSRFENSSEYSGIIGKDPKMQVVYQLIGDVASTDATVLVQGESGTGKELAALAIHRQSQRRDKPFVVINCSAYPDTMLESEIFGHEKGAFTGAIRQKAGRFEQANGGTVFLDEIGEIPPSAQIKLLRVIQTHKLKRIGGEQILSVDIRIIAATNRNLLQEVQKGNFREDLFYRLNVIPLNLPPLRERCNDIPVLVQHFLGRFAAEQDIDSQDISSKAMGRLLDYQWPGNVRELENSIEHAVVLAKGNRIEVSHLPVSIRHSDGSKIETTGSISYGTIQETEAKLLKDVLNACNWNKKQAAERLGISRNALYAKLKRYQITKQTIH